MDMSAFSNKIPVQIAKVRPLQNTVFLARTVGAIAIKHTKPSPHGLAAQMQGGTEQAPRNMLSHLL